MFAAQLIDASVPIMQDYQSVEEALLTMQDAYFRSLPVIASDGTFIGFIHEDRIMDNANPGSPVSALVEPVETLNPDTHLFDILKKCSVGSQSVMSVTDEQNQLIGCITYESIVQHLMKESSVSEPGGIIVLEIRAIDYSLAEISRIVESNSAVILHSYVSPRPDKEKILVTIKVNKIDLKEVMATFERFEYQIVAVFHVSEYEEGLRDRYESLMMYLGV